MTTLLLGLNDLEEAGQLASTLRESGHVVTIEHGAHSALSTLKHGWTDALVCDAVLPDMLSADLVTAARLLLGRPHFPAVVLCDVPPNARDRLHSLQHVTVLAAPVTPDHVVGAIAKLRIIEAGRERRKASSRSLGYRRRWDDSDENFENDSGNQS